MDVVFFLLLWIFRMESTLIGYRDTNVRSNDCHSDVYYILIFFLEKWQDLCIWLNPWGLILTHKSNSNLKACATQTWPNMCMVFYNLFMQDDMTICVKMIFSVYSNILYNFFCFIGNCKSWVTANKFAANLSTSIC